MSTPTIDKQNRISEISQWLNNSAEYERLTDYLSGIAAFTERRQQKLDAAQEECIGIWGGGDYTVETLKEIVDKWAKGEESEAARANADLQNINNELRKKNRELEASMDKMTQAILLMMRRIFSQRGTFGSRFDEDIKAWVLREATVIEDERNKGSAT